MPTFQTITKRSGKKFLSISSFHPFSKIVSVLRRFFRSGQRIWGPSTYEIRYFGVILDLPSQYLPISDFFLYLKPFYYFQTDNIRFSSTYLPSQKSDIICGWPLTLSFDSFTHPYFCYSFDFTDSACIFVRTYEVLQSN